VSANRFKVISDPVFVKDISGDISGNLSSTHNSDTKGSISNSTAEPSNAKVQTPAVAFLDHVLRNETRKRIYKGVFTLD